MYMQNYVHQILTPNRDFEIVLTVFIDPGESVGTPHFHDYIEIVYLLNGTLKFEIEGEEYFLKKHDFVLVNPMSIHHSEAKRGNTSVLLQIPMNFLKSFDERIAERKIIIDYKSKDSGVQKQIHKIGMICQELVIIYELKPVGYKFLSYSRILELVYILIHYFSVPYHEIDQTKSEKNKERILEILKYVEQHYQEHITISDAAGILGLSNIYFTRYFKKMMEMTFMEYLDKYRLQKIQKDLLYTDYSIQYILDKNGFANYKRFLKLFKDTFQCSPKEYRKRSKKSLF